MKTVSREELYEQVWARPMTKVAADYGVTGTALKKTCDRHRIPTPERGYWAKLEYGKRVKKEALPPLAEQNLALVRLSHCAGSHLPLFQTCNVGRVRARGYLGWLDTRWAYREDLDSETHQYFFRSDWADAEAWTYREDVSAGFCVAIVRRKLGWPVQYVGTICTDKLQEKACFLDNIVYESSGTKPYQLGRLQDTGFQRIGASQGRRRSLQRLTSPATSTGSSLFAVPRLRTSPSKRSANCALDQSRDRKRVRELALARLQTLKAMIADLKAAQTASAGPASSPATDHAPSSRLSRQPPEQSALAPIQIRSTPCRAMTPNPLNTGSGSSVIFSTLRRPIFTPCSTTRVLPRRRPSCPR